jgi:hypothetical protein
MGVTEMGRKSLNDLGRGTFGTGVTSDDNHCAGSLPVDNDWLIILEIGSASSMEHCLRTQQGMLLGPGDVRFNEESKLAIS